MYLSPIPQPLLNVCLVVQCNQYGHKDAHSQDEGRDPHLVRLVADEGDDHAVEVEEEHEQVETQLDEGFLSLC